MVLRVFHFFVRSFTPILIMSAISIQESDHIDTMIILYVQVMIVFLSLINLKKKHCSYKCTTQINKTA